MNTQLPAHLKAGKSKAGEQIEAVWRVRRARGAAAAAHDIVRDHLGGGAAERPPHRAVPRVDVDRAGRGMAAADQRQEVGPGVLEGGRIGDFGRASQPHHSLPLRPERLAPGA